MLRGLKSMLIHVNTSTRPSSTSGYVIFSKTHVAHVLYSIFQEKLIGNGLRYARGLPSHAYWRQQRQPGWIPQATSCQVIFSKTNMANVLYPFFLKKSIRMVWNMLRPKVMLTEVGNCLHKCLIFDSIGYYSLVCWYL